ncbi:MAG: TorF family putative porin [Rhodothermales bacterium]
MHSPHEPVKAMYRYVLSLALLLTLVTSAAAQHFSVGADVVSRYIWRGTDYGESVSVQPTLAFATGGFKVGSWASYAVDPSSGAFNEHDLWMSFSVGNISLGVTDYYFPNAGAAFFNFDDGGGAHWIEPFVSFTGPEALPISLFAGYFAYNDPDNSVYLSASYPFAVDGVNLLFTTSASAGESVLYGTDKFGIVELNLKASKAISLTENFALPLSVAYILNPYAEKSYLVFGLSF